MTWAHRPHGVRTRGSRDALSQRQRTEGRAHTGCIALSLAFRALDTHDLRRGLRGHPANRTLACISRTRHARSPQRVARARRIALSPAFRADALRPALRL